MNGDPLGPKAALEPGVVTVAIPTLNGSKFLADALASALRQTYERIEILVVDDASEDDSADIAEQYARGHPERPMRVERNRERLGLAANWNRCVELARGEYLKFLFQDDLLEPECVAELVQTIEMTPTAGMAFAPRAILLDGPRDFWTRLAMVRHGVLHTRFTGLHRVNDGRRLFREQIGHDPFRNWIGEPSVVLLRTEFVRNAGGFNGRLKQLLDVEMWLRLMCRGEVGFVARPLATCRLHSGSTTSRNVLDGAAWLDPMWIVKSLLADDCVRAQRLSLARLRIRALMRVIRGEAIRVARRRPPAILRRFSELRAYLGNSHAPRRAMEDEGAATAHQAASDSAVRPDPRTVVAVVVTHHPEAGLTSRMAHVRGQVGTTVIVDNASTPAERADIRSAADSLNGEVLENPNNVGLATALNQGLRWAAERGHAWALTLDQDTVPSPALVSEAARAYDAFRSVHPAVIGARSQSDAYEPPNDAAGRVTSVVITAGALHSIPVWGAAGGFRDDFFIDSVDTEYCLRVRSLGHAVLVVNQPTMSHSIGRPTQRRLGSRTFWTRNHDRTRWYYITRNRVITWRLYARQEPRYVLHEMGSTMWALIKVMLAEEDSRAKLAAAARGVRDGILGLGGRMST